MTEKRPSGFEAVGLLEQELGIASGFLYGLLNEDDWSLVIKAHALIEAALTHVTVAALRQEEMREVIGHLSVGDSRIGKITVAARLGLIDSPREKFFRTLGALRNKFVHDVRNVGLRVEVYAKGLPESAQADLWRSIAKGYSSAPQIEEPAGTFTPAEVYASQHPKFMIWMAVMNSLAMLYHVKTLSIRLDRL